jgi:hypothetical protein
MAAQGLTPVPAGPTPGATPGAAYAASPAPQAGTFAVQSAAVTGD